MPAGREPLADYVQRPTRRRLALVVRRYHEFVWRKAYEASGRHESDAADICQDVFLKLLLQPPPAERVRTAHGYLGWAVLRRTALRRLKREEATARKHLDGVAPTVDIEDLYDAVGGLPNDLRVAVRSRRQQKGDKHSRLATPTFSPSPSK